MNQHPTNVDCLVIFWGHCPSLAETMVIRMMIENSDLGWEREEILGGRKPAVLDTPFCQAIIFAVAHIFLKTVGSNLAGKMLRYDDISRACYHISQKTSVICERGLPYMTSAVSGGGTPKKQTKETYSGVKKSQNFADLINGSSLRMISDFGGFQCFILVGNRS